MIDAHGGAGGNGEDASCPGRWDARRQRTRGALPLGGRAGGRCWPRGVVLGSRWVRLRSGGSGLACADTDSSFGRSHPGSGHRGDLATGAPVGCSTAANLSVAPLVKRPLGQNDGASKRVVSLSRAASQPSHHRGLPPPPYFPCYDWHAAMLVYTSPCYPTFHLTRAYFEALGGPHENRRIYRAMLITAAATPSPSIIVKTP